MSDKHEKFMAVAIKQAELAAAHGEVPVGACIVCADEVIAVGRNTPITDCDPCGHAEIHALREAGKVLSNYRLNDCALYVTLEPCAMCAGAIVHSRIKRLVYAARDEKTGCAGSVENLLQHPQFNHHVDIVKGPLEQQCSSLISDFFKRRRQEIKAAKLHARSINTLKP